MYRITQMLATQVVNQINETFNTLVGGSSGDERIVFSSGKLSIKKTVFKQVIEKCECLMCI
jgi:hypothetical protein